MSSLTPAVAHPADEEGVHDEAAHEEAASLEKLKAEEMVRDEKIKEQEGIFCEKYHKELAILADKKGASSKEIFLLYDPVCGAPPEVDPPKGDPPKGDTSGEVAASDLQATKK